MKINFQNLLFQTLPPLKRMPIRLKFLCALISPLQRLWHEFLPWRQQQRTMINMYGCQILMEGWLRERHATDQIKVVTSRSLYPKVGLREEGRTAMVTTGLRAEALERARFSTYLRSDQQTEALDVDFEVYAPGDIDLARITLDIERIKPFSTTYRLIINTKQDEKTNTITRPERLGRRRSD